MWRRWPSSSKSSAMEGRFSMNSWHGFTVLTEIRQRHFYGPPSASEYERREMKPALGLFVSLAFAAQGPERMDQDALTCAIPTPRQMRSHRVCTPSQYAGRQFDLPLISDLSDPLSAQSGLEMTQPDIPLSFQKVVTWWCSHTPIRLINGEGSLDNA